MQTNNNMAATKNDILNTLREIKPTLVEKYYVAELALFGSYARNEQTEYSDIDLMVTTNGGTFRDFSNLYHQLKQFFPQHNVQVVSKKAIKPQYFERLEKDLLYV